MSYHVKFGSSVTKGVCINKKGTPKIRERAAGTPKGHISHAPPFGCGRGWLLKNKPLPQRTFSYHCRYRRQITFNQYLSPTVPKHIKDGALFHTVVGIGIWTLFLATEGTAIAELQYNAPSHPRGSHSTFVSTTGRLPRHPCPSLPAVPRSTQPSTLRGTVNEYQLSGWVIIINGDGGCRR